jgi:hypothetical protein
VLRLEVTGIIEGKTAALLKNVKKPDKIVDT